MLDLYAIPLPASVWSDSKSRRNFFSAQIRKIIGFSLNLDPKGVEIQTTPEGKPFVSNHPIHFSISHSKDLALLAVSSTNVGVDIEVHKPTRDWAGIAGMYMGWSEEQIESSGENGFYLQWTASEAVYKLCGGQFSELLQIAWQSNSVSPSGLPLSITWGKYEGATWCLASHERLPQSRLPLSPKSVDHK